MICAGIIPSELGGLSVLKTLMLMYNQLSGESVRGSQFET